MNKQSIADRLKKARGRRTHREVAAAVGISRSALNMYELAQRVPKDEIKVKLAEYYGLSVEELFY